MTFRRSTTSRDMLRVQSCEVLLGCSVLSQQERYEQARFAQQVRNFWTTATLLPMTVAETSVQSSTTAFSDPLIVTDLLAMFLMGTGSVGLAGAPLTDYLIQAFEYGKPGHSSGLDFFGLSGPSQQNYILKHERNRSGVFVGPNNLHEREASWLSFTPRILAPYQTLRFVYTLPASGIFLEVARQVGVRALRVLLPDNPYSYFSTLLDSRIRQHIKDARPETFYLEANLPLAQFPPAAGFSVLFKTPQQDRPLLVLGASSNVRGVQAELIDKSKYYTFTASDIPLTPRAGVTLGYKAPPLSLWAANTDFRNPEMFTMWPVPHLLEPGAQLEINLTSGLGVLPNNSFAESMLTRSEQPARVTFICRTV